MAVPKLRFKGFISDWDSRKFSDTLSFLGTNSFSRDNMNLVSGSVKNIHYGDILVIYGNVLDTSCEQIPFVNEDVNISKIKEKDYLLSGDVIIADTAEDYTVGKATEIINSKGIKIIAGLHTQACRPKRKFAVGYLGNFVNSLAFRKQIRRIAQGTKVLSIIKKYIEDTEIHFPIEKEQQKIADFLTTFDKRITAQQNIIADLEETKKGLLQKIFSQEIRFKDDNGQDYPEWEEKRLGDISYVMRGLTYKPTDVRDDGIRVFRSSNISEDTFIYGEDDVFVDVNAVNIPFVQNGDILITAANGSSRLVGKHSVIHGVLNDTAVHGGFMLLIRSKDSAFINSSMYSSWYKKFVYKFVAGGNGAIGNLKKSDLENVHLFVPCEKEKNKIDDFLSIFDKKITAEKQVLSDLQEMKKGLLQQMFV